MSTEYLHPTVEAVLSIHAEVLAAHGGRSGLISRELLESAVAAPQARRMAQPKILDPMEIAAAYLFYLCSNGLPETSPYPDPYLPRRAPHQPFRFGCRM